MDIIQLPKEMNDKEIVFEYMTPGHFKVTTIKQAKSFTLNFTFEKFDQPIYKSFTDRLVGSYLENPQSYGILIDQEVVAYLVINFEKYNNRMRIVQLLVEQNYRRQGLGKILMDFAEEKAREVNARALVLETQSCNIPAITFYEKCGYQIIGCDLISYSNSDIDNSEVRLEMAKILLID